MSLSTENDPVEATRLMLDNAAASKWPSSTAPDRIEASEDSDPGEKESAQRRSQVSLYLAQDVDGDLTKQSAEGGIDRTHIVNVAIWTGDSDTTFSYKRAVEDIATDYVNDNKTNTQFVDVFPVTITDDRAQNFYASGFAIETVGVRLRGYDDL